MPQPPPLRDYFASTDCAFCSRGLHHERACMTEREAEVTLGLKFDASGLILQVPETIRADHYPESAQVPFPSTTKPLLGKPRNTPTRVR